MDNSYNGIEYRMLTQAQKNANNFLYYRRKCDLLDMHSRMGYRYVGRDGISEYKRMKVNYDLFNNIIDVKDFEYVCKPFGAVDGELPASMVNRDILSPKIKVLLGMEMKMPFSWKIAAINEEATTRREQEEFKRIRDFVVSNIVGPIRTQIEQQKAAEAQGQELTEEQKLEIQRQIEEEVKAATPEEVKKYMLREHQDPAEVLATQLLEYIVKDQDLVDKFNKLFKHGIISGKEVGLVTLLNGKPHYRVVNSLYFNSDVSHDVENVEDGEWATCEYRMTPSEIMALFGPELTNAQRNKVYDRFATNRDGSIAYATDDVTFTFDETNVLEGNTIRVLHCNWKDLRKVGFLLDEDGEPLDMVDENYKPSKGEKIEWEWIPEAHECWKILDDIYVYQRPVPGQHLDLDNLFECKLSYYGRNYDNLNSQITSAMDRGKSYQYFYDVVMFRMEMALASDKGKKLLMNVNAIPTTNGFDMKKFLYYLDALGIGFLNPSEKGGIGSDVTNLVKEVDMSFVGQIQHYINIAEYIDRRCGETIGVTKPMEGQISPTDAVTNTKQNIVQASHIIQPYFNVHNMVKANTLKALLKITKVAYSTGKPQKLSYILDDMSLRTLFVDQGLLDESTLGLFVSDSGKAQDAKDAMMNLAHAALQTQQANLSDIAKIIRSDSIVEAEELLEAAEARATENQQQMEQYKQEMAQKLAESERAWEREKMRVENENKLEQIRTKGEEDRKTAAIVGIGFDEDKDRNSNNTPDIIEYANAATDASLKERKQDLDERKFEADKEHNAEKLKLEARKIKAGGSKK